jgi:hypothetical protein
MAQVATDLLADFQVGDCAGGVDASADEHGGEIDPFGGFHLVQDEGTGFDADEFSGHHGGGSAGGGMLSVGPGGTGFAGAVADARGGDAVGGEPCGRKDGGGDDGFVGAPAVGFEDWRKHCGWVRWAGGRNGDGKEFAGARGAEAGDGQVDGIAGG